MKPVQTGRTERLYQYAAVLFLATLLLRIILIGYYNYNFGGIETNVVYGIQRIMAGQPLYQDPSSGAYAVMQYTPVYYCFVAAIAKLSGISWHDVQSIFVVCRISALFFNLLTIIAAALIIRRWAHNFWQSLLFSLPLLLILTTHYYTRGDSMHLFFFVFAICAYIYYNDRRAFSNLVLAALLSASCIMIKQSGVLVAGVIGFHLCFISRKYRTAAIYLITTFAFTCLIAVLLTQGNWLAFYQNAYLGLKNGIDPSFLYDIFISHFYLEMVPCYVLGFILVRTALKKNTDPTFGILATGIALSWLFAVVTGLKIGSSNNYFTEFLVFIILCLPYLLQYATGETVLFTLYRYPLTLRRFARLALLVLITSKTMGLFTAVFIEKRLANQRTEYNREQALYSYFENTLKIKKGAHVLFTERYFLDNLFFDYSIMPTKDVVSQTWASSPFTFNYATFYKTMNTGLVSYIVTDAGKKDINQWSSEIPFMIFDKTKFTRLADTAGYSIYSYVQLTK
jgi:hypothetical protein